MMSCALLLVSGCAKPPVIEPPPLPVTVAVDVAAADSANPDATGRASPVTVRVYALTDETAFSKADFFVLWEREAEALGATSLGVHEFPLAPGAAAQTTFKLDPAMRVVGVAAAFRDFRSASWRTSVAVPAAPAPGSTIKLTVTVDNHAVIASWQ